MTPAFRRTALIATVAALPLMSVMAPGALAQSNDTRYGSWAPPGATAGATATTDAKLESLLKELKALVAEAEKARAADRLFLRDLKDLAARYENPWTQRQLFDDFSDNELMRNPTWSITSGEYWVEQGYGLRSRSTAAPAARQERKVSKEEMAISILGAVLSGAAKNGGGTATTTTTPKAQPAVIETQARISNAFAFNMQFSSWKAEGAFEAAVTQGVSGAGYRVVYTPGQSPKLELVRVTSRGRGIVDSKTVTALEDNKIHTLGWTRGADGTMTVSVDGAAVLNARDTAFRDPFSGLAIVNAGTDIIVKSVEVLGAP